MRSATCPSCDADIEIGAMPAYGLRLECPVCDAALKIIWLDPVELDWWDYEDDDERVDHYDDDEDDEIFDKEIAEIGVHAGFEEVDIDEIYRISLDDGIADGTEDSAEDYREDRELLDS